MLSDFTINIDSEACLVTRSIIPLAVRLALLGLRNVFFCKPDKLGAPNATSTPAVVPGDFVEPGLGLEKLSTPVPALALNIFRAAAASVKLWANKPYMMRYKSKPGTYDFFEPNTNFTIQILL